MGGELLNRPDNSGMQFSFILADIGYQKAHVNRRITVYVKLTKKNIHCDLCGEIPTDGEIYQNDNYICLCLKCLKKLDVMPVKMKEIIERYIEGNVV
jgi:hypothetical protein